MGGGKGNGLGGEHGGGRDVEEVGRGLDGVVA